MSRALASLRLTTITLLGLAATIFGAYVGGSVARGWIAAPLALLTANLIAALATNARLRHEPALLVFHLALVAVSLLCAADALTRFHGRVELVEGQAFGAAQIHATEQGIWHRLRLEDVALVQQEIEVEFAPGMSRQRTRSRVTAAAAAGGVEHHELGESRSLTVSGYRFSTSSNKGYALLLTWRGADGGQMTGAVHLPSFPAHEWRQNTVWTTPVGEEIEFAFHPLDRVPANAHWTLRSAGTRAQVQMRRHDAATAMAAGEWLAVSGGALRLDGIRMWMGYRVDSQPLLPWLLAAALIGVFALGAHFYARLWRGAMPGETDREWRRNGSVARL